MMPLHKILACSLTVLTALTMACNDMPTQTGGEMQGSTFAKGTPGPPSGHEPATISHTP